MAHVRLIIVEVRPLTGIKNGRQGLDTHLNYVVNQRSSPLPLTADWDFAAWQGSSALEIRHFLPQSSAHRPSTAARLLYDTAGIHGIFRVKDRYVRCVRTRYCDEVWKDSCVEIFVQPKPNGGYFNFEFNCGGAHLCNYITDWTRTPEGFKSFVRIPPGLGRQVGIKGSLPSIVDPEIAEPTDWTLQFFIPYTLFEAYLGPVHPVGGKAWRGNLFKCAEEVSHPHWAAWSAVDEFNFHLPRCFGDIMFGAGNKIV